MNNYRARTTFTPGRVGRARSQVQTLLESPVSALTPKGIEFLMGWGQTDIRMSLGIVGRVVSGPVGRSSCGS